MDTTIIWSQKLDCFSTDGFFFYPTNRLTVFLFATPSTFSFFPFAGPCFFKFYFFYLTF